ncbi:TIGR03084 family metal-binding protein [Nocardia sp. NPDC057227]|uniref:TIGR03084 family metal-binding protein n=1 Tax=Nocardia sp. NPDC057227 TaxID=3346056 RepID=UPI00362CF5BF
MGLDFPALLGDLAWETDRLTETLAGLNEPQWEQPTPAAGWAVRDQVSHLAYFDDCAVLALADPTLFEIDAARLVARGDDFPDLVAADNREMPVAELVDWFTTSRRHLLTAFAEQDPRRRLPWFGPPMSVASSVTARLMETWAHGRDIYDTIGATQPIGRGLRSICHLGVSTFGFSHALRGLDVPRTPVRVELTAPDAGATWSWGPDDATDRITGPAEDFALVVTQRRHPLDTALTITGPVARSWTAIAQAFAGAPGPGRPPTGGRS